MARRELAYASALVVGLAVPLSVIAPWIADHGIDLPLLVRELFASGVSSFFGVDVIVTVVVLFLVAAVDAELSTRSRVLVVLASLLGASVGLPTYLLARELDRRGGAPAADQRGRIAAVSAEE